MNLGIDTVLQRQQGAQGSRLGKEFVVLDAAGKMVRSLNATGGRIWGLVDGVHSVRDIAQQLAREYGTAEGHVLTDVLTFLESMTARGLLLEVSS